jgi:hypothetical protein
MTNLIIRFGSFGILTILWLGFGVALIFNQALLDTTWQLFRGMALWAQVGIGLLFLPLTLGLWIWQTPMPLWIRLIIIISLAIASIYTFLLKPS